MSSKTISIRHYDNGVLTDATSVQFDNGIVGVGGFGVRRQSNGEIILAAGTDLDHAGTGLYSKTITGLVAGQTYEYWLEVIYLDGPPLREERTFVAALEESTGSYASDSDLDDLRGIDNITAWSDIENTGNRNNDRIQRALDWSEMRIEQELGHIYSFPLSGLTSNDEEILRYWSAVLASWWLFKNRGQPDNEIRKHPYKADYDEVLADIWRYVGNERWFTATRQVDGQVGMSLATGNGNGLGHRDYILVNW